jgi:hypothetical protein
LVDFLALVGAFFFGATGLAGVFTVALLLASLLLLDSAFLIIWANQSSTSSLLPAFESALDSLADTDVTVENRDDFDSEGADVDVVDTEGLVAICFGCFGPRFGRLIFPSFTSFNFPTGSFLTTFTIVFKTFFAV